MWFNEELYRCHVTGNPSPFWYTHCNSKLAVAQSHLKWCALGHFPLPSISAIGIRMRLYELHPLHSFRVQISTILMRDRKAGVEVGLGWGGRAGGGMSCPSLEKGQSDGQAGRQALAEGEERIASVDESSATEN